MDIAWFVEASKRLDKAKLSSGNNYTVLLSREQYLALGGTEEYWDSIESEDPADQNLYATDSVNETSQKA